MKKYIDELDWRKKHGEYNEPCISYRSPCVILFNYFARKVR